MRTKWRRLPAAIRAAIIGGVFVILAAILGALLPTLLPDKGNTPELPKAAEILVRIQISNPGLSEVVIYKYGNFSLIKQLETKTWELVPGEYALTSDEIEYSQKELIEIGPGETVSMKATISSSYLRILEKGEHDLCMSFHRNDNSSFISETMPFTEAALKEYYLLANASK